MGKMKNRQRRDKGEIGRKKGGMRREGEYILEDK